MNGEKEKPKSNFNFEGNRPKYIFDKKDRPIIGNTIISVPKRPVQQHGDFQEQIISELKEINAKLSIIIEKFNSSGK